MQKRLNLTGFKGMDRRGWELVYETFETAAHSDGGEIMQAFVAIEGGFRIDWVAKDMIFKGIFSGDEKGRVRSEEVCGWKLE